MAERIFIGVAWPYANGHLHLGHIAGAYLPADIFARYHRIKGNEVLMVSGSDQHGTPVTIRAEAEGKTPQEVVSRYHQGFLDSWKKLGISFDLFTTTGTENHARVAQDFFLKLLDKGYIYKAKMPLPYCHNCRRFLPDRYVEGTCPNCKSPKARGDQCDDCGKPLNPADLIESRCSICKTPPEIKDSEHFFLRLSAFSEQLKSWVQEQNQNHWRPNVLNFTQRYLTDGLRDRAITRDIEWGVPIPLPGFDQKRIYVWFEAVIGYLSASKEWSESTGNSDKWSSYWRGDTKSYYFIGKDNIVFHTIIWPAMLMGYGDLNLPYNVPANEFLTLDGKKLSTSRNWAVWIPDYLERYPADPLRYLMSANMPETSDADFSWREYVRRNNDELVATYGNLVQRVLSLTYRNFDGCVPATSERDPESNALLNKAKTTFDTVDKLLYDCHFREAIREAMALAQETNRYLDNKAPWKKIKDDKESAATALVTALGVICCLKTVFYPFLPFSSEKLHHLLGYSGRVEDTGWSFAVPPAGQRLLPPEHLFSKLDDKVVEEENALLVKSSLHPG
ncbi:MAG: methionine--tRNA ligase [Chloroflexi bacterium RBG_13_52_14]|nr:MAG: methionine--tRNA ligase [Chloroflexi bacterium RBG_13_52_14]